MSELLEERLRKAAQTCRNLGNHTAEGMFLEAADTIWQLRDDLQRANAAVQDAEHDESMAWDRVRKAESENAKLRELVTYMWTYDYAGHFSTLSEHMEHVDAVWQQMQLLRIEVGK